MNYYIKGDVANADKINAAFEKLGYDTSGHLFNAKSVLYFTLDGEIRATTCNCTPAIIKTHPDYKELELTVEPKFKVGDSLQSGSYFTKILSINLEEGRYYCDNRIISFKNQDLWHLVPKPHYDISNFHAGMPVLVRDYNKTQWRYVQFSHYVGGESSRFNACGNCWCQCIPFEGNETLLGTTDMCDEMYINW